VFKNRVIVEGSWNEFDDADNMWKEMTTHIRKMAIEVFGVTIGNKYEPKNTWWWNDDVQKTINEKKECYKRLYHNRSDENIQKYKEARKNAKKAVTEVRGQTYTELYRKLDTKKSENNVYKKAKLRERRIRDFNQVKCIKDETDILLVKDEEIKNRWR
jgi:dipeptidase